jgi:hypothetical protein
VLTLLAVLQRLQDGEAVCIRIRAGGRWIALEVQSPGVVVAREMPPEQFAVEFITARMLYSLLVSARSGR